MTTKPVIVTTEFRGVFFGYVPAELYEQIKARDEASLPKLTITGAKNCLYWHSSIGGFLGLASVGPNDQCKIGKRVNEVTLYKITSVTPVEDVAVTAWERI